MIKITTTSGHVFSYSGKIDMWLNKDFLTIRVTGFKNDYWDKLLVDKFLPGQIKCIDVIY